MSSQSPSPSPSPTPDASQNGASAAGPKREGRFAGANLRQPQASASTPPSAGLAHNKAPCQTAAPSNTVTKTPACTNRRCSDEGPKAPTQTARRFSPVPASLLTDAQLLSDMQALPGNYSFELPKTIHRLREARSSRVALQMPEGLLLYATTLSDIVVRHTAVKSTVILSDVTYGACCVDDLSAQALTCDFLVHYGHSCLIPISQTRIPTLYVFIHIAFDTSHLVQALLHNFSPDDHIALLATIQFVDSVHDVAQQVKNRFPHMFVPQRRPLSPGELLGCTAPTLPEATDVIVYVGDGRFHLESVMISNPNIRALRYDPYAKRLTEEQYATDEMLHVRKRAISVAAHARTFGIVLGTLGRQGSPNILKRLMKELRQSGKTFVVVLLSEITLGKLRALQAGGISAWVQIACPRLSIDWGEAFSSAPLLTPYECFVALGSVPWRDVYPMDYYAKDGGQWSNYYKEGAQAQRRRGLAGPIGQAKPNRAVLDAG